MFGYEPARVQAFLAALQEDVAQGDVFKVAKVVHYPLRVDGKSIRDQEELIGSYARIFDDCVKRQIQKQRFDSLFVNWQGMMIGRGQIWFSGTCRDGDAGSVCDLSDLRIVSINTGKPTCLE